MGEGARIGRRGGGGGGATATGETGASISDSTVAVDGDALTSTGIGVVSSMVSLSGGEGVVTCVCTGGVSTSIGRASDSAAGVSFEAGAVLVCAAWMGVAFASAMCTSACSSAADEGPLAADTPLVCVDGEAAISTSTVAASVASLTDASTRGVVWCVVASVLAGVELVGSAMVVTAGRVGADVDVGSDDNSGAAAGADISTGVGVGFADAANSASNLAPSRALRTI